MVSVKVDVPSCRDLLDGVVGVQEGRMGEVGV